MHTHAHQRIHPLTHTHTHTRTHAHLDTHAHSRTHAHTDTRTHTSLTHMRTRLLLALICANSPDAITETPYTYSVLMCSSLWCVVITANLRYSIFCCLQEAKESVLPFPQNETLLELCGPLANGLFVRPRSGFITPIWYKYDSELMKWFWTPDNAQSFWMGCDTLVVSQGFWSGHSPAPCNVFIIDELNRTSPVPEQVTPSDSNMDVRCDLSLFFLVSSLSSLSVFQWKPPWV